MAKITDLDLPPSPLDGSELVPLVQGGAMWKSPIGVLVEALAQPFVDQAQAIADEMAADRATLNETLSEFVAGTWTSQVTGYYKRQDNGTDVLQAAWAYKTYTVSADDVRDDSGKPIIELTFQLNTPSSVIAAAIYLDASGTVIGREYVGAGGDIPLQTKLLDAPAATVTVVADYQPLVFTPTFRTRRIPDAIAERLAEQEALTTPVPSVVTSLSGWEGQTPAYVADRIVNRTTGAVVNNADFRYYVVDVNADAGERLRVLSGSFNSGTTYAALVCFSKPGGPTTVGTTVTGSFVTGTLSAQDVRAALIAAGNADGIPNLPAGTRSVAIVNRELEAQIVVQLFHVVPDVVEQLNALKNGGSGRANGTVWAESTGTTTNGIFDELQALLPDIDLDMQAIGGQLLVDHIQYRMGFKKTSITIDGNQIPASGSATCTLANDMLKPPSSVTNSMQVMVRGIRCKLTRTGGPDDGSHTITAMDSIGIAQPVPAGSEVTVLTGFVAGSDASAAKPLALLLSGINFLRVSFNDRYSSNYEELAQVTQGLVAYIGPYSPKQYWISPLAVQIMLPTTDSDAGLAVSQAQAYGFLQHVRMMRQIMASFAPRHFDAMAFHIAAGATEVKTINGVNYDVLTLTAPSVALNVDKTHELTSAQASIAAAMVDDLRSIGWVS